MIKYIPISEELRNYLERLNYEEVRYCDFLQTVSRDSCPMTDEEWESSLEYYDDKMQEAKLAKQFAMEEIVEIYKNEIDNQKWYIDFSRCYLVVGADISECAPKEKFEQYSEYLDRLYPEEIGKLSINSSHVKDITLQVTDACNMACTYCYQHNKGHHSMSFETAKKFIDMILDADELVNSYITSTISRGAVLDFIGGEPLLEIDLVSKVSDYFMGELFRRKHPWAIKFMFSVCSNGLLHFDPKVQEYLKKHSKHISYSISIDGNKSLHDSCRVDLAGNGTYDRAIAAVNHYREALDGYMGSKMTIAPGNVDKVFEAVSYMIEKNGYNHINLNCVYEEGWTINHATTLYWELHKLADWIVEKGLQDKVELSIFEGENGQPMREDDNSNWCGGTGLMIALDYKGDIFPCLRYMESSVSDKVPPYIIGNLDCGINKIQEHKDRLECMSCITRRSQSTDECFNCLIAKGCAWCSAYNYEVFGTPNKRATFSCDMHKARSLATVYYKRAIGKEYPLYCPKEWAIEIIGEEEYNKLYAMEVTKIGNNC